MTTMVEPITEQELIGYLAAMLGDQPLGDPATSVEVLGSTSGSQ